MDEGSRSRRDCRHRPVGLGRQVAGEHQAAAGPGARTTRRRATHAVDVERVVGLVEQPDAGFVFRCRPRERDAPALALRQGANRCRQGGGRCRRRSAPRARWPDRTPMAVQARRELQRLGRAEVFLRARSGGRSRPVGGESSRCAATARRPARRRRRPGSSPAAIRAAGWCCRGRCGRAATGRGLPSRRRLRPAKGSRSPRRQARSWAVSDGNPVLVIEASESEAAPLGGRAAAASGPSELIPGAERVVSTMSGFYVVTMAPGWLISHLAGGAADFVC